MDDIAIVACGESELEPVRDNRKMLRPIGSPAVLNVVRCSSMIGSLVFKRNKHCVT